MKKPKKIPTDVYSIVIDKVVRHRGKRKGMMTYSGFIEKGVERVKIKIVRNTDDTDQ